MSKIKWIIFSIITIGTFALLIVFSNGPKLNVDTVDVNAIQTANEQDGNIADHIYGNANSTVTLINYGDFQCPGCGQAHPEIKSIIEQYKDQIRFVFRNFPLTTIHANAKAAAGAAEAAGLQGKYWEMFNKIYESQSAWSNLDASERNDFFAKYASDLGLDTAKFNTDLQAAPTTINKKIDYDYALGKKAGVDSTPTFFLDGVKLDSKVWGDSNKLKDAINTELTKAGIELPK